MCLFLTHKILKPNLKSNRYWLFYRWDFSAKNGEKRGKFWEQPNIKYIYGYGCLKIVDKLDLDPDSIHFSHHRPRLRTLAAEALNPPQ